MKILKKILIFLTIGILLTSCVELETKVSEIEYSEKILIAKTTEVSGRHQQITVYLLAFNDGYTLKTTFGNYSCRKIGDTIVLQKRKNRFYWNLKPNCK